MNSKLSNNRTASVILRESESVRDKEGEIEIKKREKVIPLNRTDRKA
jgi:hypothetical protein